jgi:hypothetical protein
MGTHQGGDDDASSRGLLEQLLSAGSLPLLRMPGDDLATSQHAGGNDNDPNVEDGEPVTQNDDEGDDDDELEYGYWGRSHARTPKWFPPVTTPQEAGLKLLMGGEFGRIGIQARAWKGNTDVSKVILSRRSRLRPTSKQDIANVRAVCSVGNTLDHENSPSYRTPVVRLSRHCAITYTVANTLKVRTRLQLTPTLLDMRIIDSSFYYTCCRGGFRSTLPIAITKLY